MHKKIGYKILLLGVIIIFSIWAHMVIQQPALSNVSNIDSATNLRVDELIKLFQGNELQSTATYTNQVISVHGTIKDISFLNNRNTIILESENFKKNFVICDMSPISNKVISELTIGDTISLKGICKGYLLDVILLNCIPTNEKP